MQIRVASTGEEICPQKPTSVPKRRVSVKPDIPSAVVSTPCKLPDSGYTPISSPPEGYWSIPPHPLLCTISSSQVLRSQCGGCEVRAAELRGPTAICASCGKPVTKSSAMDECDIQNCIDYQSSIGNPPPNYREDGTIILKAITYDSRHCVMCGRSLIGRRDDAEVCSPTCRVRRQRQRETEARLKAQEAQVEKDGA